MIKVVMGGSFDGMEQQFAEIIKVASTGIDQGWMTKRAAISDRIKTEIRPEKGKTFVHLLALGDGETYGCNRNGDFFSKEANEKYHKTFEKHAHFFRHHQNKDPKKSFGTVKVAEYNPDMRRVELVVALDNDKCSDELDLLEKKGEFPVSMACRVPFDVCSICGHKATHKEAQYEGDEDAYCDHASKYLTKIAADGRTVYVDNTQPTFFDISRVRRPADRIAYTFEKVASGGIESGVDLARAMGFYDAAYLLENAPAGIRKKAEMLQKLQVTHSDATSPIAQAAATIRNLPDRVIEKFAAYSTTQEKFKDLLGALADKQLMLTAHDFFKIASGSEFHKLKPHLDAIEGALPGIFSGIADTEVEGFCKDASFDCGTGLVPKALRDEISACAGNAINIAASQSRLIKHASSLPEIKIASVSNVAPVVMNMAREYAKYQLGFLVKNSSHSDIDLMSDLTVFYNFVR